MTTRDQELTPAQHSENRLKLLLGKHDKDLTWFELLEKRARQLLDHFEMHRGQLPEPLQVGFVGLRDALNKPMDDKNFKGKADTRQNLTEPFRASSVQLQRESPAVQHSGAASAELEAKPARLAQIRQEHPDFNEQKVLAEYERVRALRNAPNSRSGVAPDRTWPEGPRDTDERFRTLNNPPPEHPESAVHDTSTGRSPAHDDPKQSNPNPTVGPFKP